MKRVSARARTPLERRNILKFLPVAATAAVASPSLLAGAHAPNFLLALEPAGMPSMLPLQEIKVHLAGQGLEGCSLVVIDGAGREYHRTKAENSHSFLVGGALGRHTVQLLDSKSATVAEASFRVDCSTELHDEGRVHSGLLKAVLWTMMSWSGNNPVSTIHYKDRVYQLFAGWIFDHTLILKGMKYFWPNLKDGIDFFADTQREDGMIFENCYPATPDKNFFDWKFDYDGFIERFGDDFWQLRRAPVESHVEQYFVEGLYATWKATGDLEWMKSRLNNAIRALRQVTKSPYRWSQKYQLMHRGFTIDTWDYVSDDQQRFGGSVFMVYLDKSEFGIFHGDNTNLIFQCRNLAEMLKLAGRAPDAPEFEELANDVEKRLNALAWNGNFYTHWIAENPDYKPDVGVDMSVQVSLSNAYALNRGISHEQCTAILKTYQRIRSEMPSTSPGEYYGIYPPFQKDFTQNIPGLVWEYCNGGVLNVVGGELAHGAFEHGYESYGADILARIKTVADRYHGYLPVTLRGKAAETPQRTFQKINLRMQANASHGKGSAGLASWSNQAEMNLVDVPTGTQEFQWVPFDVLSLTENSGRSSIILSRQPNAASVTIPANAIASSVYLLNAADGRGAAGSMLTFHYADGSLHCEDVATHSWAFPSDSRYAKEGPRTEDTYRVAWKKTTPDDQEAGIYVTGVNNPHPDREIASMELSAGGARSRWLVLAATLSSAPVYFAPYDDLSTGIPDGWNGSILFALFEGLAGIKDLGSAFSKAAIMPRWVSAKVPTAEITLRYPSSAGYVSYKYRDDHHSITLDFTASAEAFDVEILLPTGRKVASVTLNGKTASTTQRKIEDSHYLVLPTISSGVHRLTVGFK
jgi:hypothetical protein